ncbi:IPT/TIG domain-containing protein [Nocardia asteroides]
MPTITSISPTSGPTTGGNSVTITGTGFTGPTTVRFGNTATTFTMNSPTQITAIAPAGSPGTVQVTVTTAAGTSNGLPYTYLAVPSLSSVSPSQGSTAGGTTVTLTGSGLTGVTSVNFGATPAASFTVNSDNQITAVSPPGSGIVFDHRHRAGRYQQPGHLRLCRGADHHLHLTDRGSRVGWQQCRHHRHRVLRSVDGSVR